MEALKLKRRGTAHAAPETRRAQILEAALRCFAERGYPASTMDDVARVSGLSKGSLYRFFSSKDEVLVALFETFDRRIAESFARDSDGPDVFRILERAGSVVLETLGAQGELLPAWFELFAQRGLRDRFAELYRRTRREFAGTIQRGIDAGQLRAVAPEDLASGLLATIEGLLLQTMVDPGFDARARWPAIWETFRRGLELSGSPPSL